MDEAGLETAHVVGNSLGGYVALQLAARGRAESVVALAPAGGWAKGDESYKKTADFFATLQEEMKGVALHAESVVATDAGRRQATQLITTNYAHIPTELLVHHIVGIAACTWTRPLIQQAVRNGYPLDAAEQSAARCGSCGGRGTGCCRGRRRRCASARTGSRTPTGSSSTASATARSSTSRSRRRS